MDFGEKMYLVIKIFLSLVWFMQKYVDPPTPYKKIVLADSYSQ